MGGLGKAGALHQLVVQARQLRVRVAPVQGGKAKIQIAQCAAHRHVGQCKVVAVAVRLVPDVAAHVVQCGVDLAQLALDPGLGTLPGAAPGPDQFLARQHGGVHQAVGHRFPGLDGNALAAQGGHQAAHGRQGVEVFHNHARVEHRRIAFNQQAWHLAQRVVLRHDGVGREHIVLHQRAIELFFGQHDAHFAHERAGGVAYEFHRLVRPAAWPVSPVPKDCNDGPGGGALLQSGAS